MKPRLDDSNAELAGILDALVAADITITVREVARRHPTLRNASAFTRNAERMKLIEQSQNRQVQLRTTLNPHVVRASSLSEQLDHKSDRVTQLEQQVKTLVTSHAACIQAVMAAGGMAALERYWKEYKAIGESLRAVSAFPDSADVVRLRQDKS
jgi:hypothetical protein